MGGEYQFDLEINRLEAVCNQSLSVTDFEEMCKEICIHAKRDAAIEARLKQWVLSAVVPDSGAAYEIVGYFIEVFRWPEVREQVKRHLASGLDLRLQDFYRLLLPIWDGKWDDRDMFNSLSEFEIPD